MNVSRSWIPYLRTTRNTSHRLARRLWCSLAGLLLASLAHAQSATPFCFGDGTSTVPGGNCPCGVLQNGSPGEGCLNSTGTGGLLSASGNSCITSGCGADTLSLSASGLPATAPCILMTSSTPLAPAVFFGDGIRCVGGNIQRLYLSTASAGSVKFPPSAALSISAQSAALGGLILPGTSRVYQAYYRDPPPPHCPPATFNITNGIVAVWR